MVFSVARWIYGKCHIYLRTILNQLLSHVWNDVNISNANWRKIYGERFTGVSTRISDGAKENIRARGFWTNYKISYFFSEGFSTETPRVRD